MLHKFSKPIIALATIIFAIIPLQTHAQHTTKQIKQRIIAESIASYSGNCPCPYNITRSGRKCGKRSAYYRKGGAAPLCYESDVTEGMVERYRK